MLPECPNWLYCIHVADEIVHEELCHFRCFVSLSIEELARNSEWSSAQILPKCGVAMREQDYLQFLRPLSTFHLTEDDKQSDAFLMARPPSSWQPSVLTIVAMIAESKNDHRG